MKRLAATLIPREFGQQHPFSASSFEAGYHGTIYGSFIGFGVRAEYEAKLDDGQRFEVFGAPCTVKMVDGVSLRCTIEIEGEILALLQRYGANTYNELFRLAAQELQRTDEASR